MHFELQVGSPWINLAESFSVNFNSSFHFKVIAYFLLAVAILFFRQTCEEIKAILIVFFRLLLVSVELNE